MSEMVDGRLFGADQPCFGCGPQHPLGFRLRFWRDGDEVVTRFVPAEGYQGPPGIMHGGLVTTLADEVAVWAAIVHLEKFAFTASVQAKLHRPVRIGTEVEARGRIVDDRRRVLDSSVRIVQDGIECFTGEFRLVVLDEQGAERLLGQPLPQAWKRFGR